MATPMPQPAVLHFSSEYLRGASDKRDNE